MHYSIVYVNVKLKKLIQKLFSFLVFKVDKGYKA